MATPHQKHANLRLPLKRLNLTVHVVSFWNLGYAEISNPLFVYTFGGQRYKEIRILNKAYGQF